MLSVVSRLLQECDRVVKSLIENWEEERQMQRKVCCNRLLLLYANLTRT